MADTTQQTSWWEQTLDYVVRAAADKNFRQPQLQNGQSYFVDQNGNVIPAGRPTPNGMAPGMQGMNPLLIAAGVLIVGVLLYKLVD
jgi:hypothetical protein